ncbi:MAG: hypothetical protein INH41_23270 [Myxococcaceae bacterium]|jgi:hypothetical protein|nr:hypothetical protein [Myxococcaceae bacterium]
MARSVVVSVVVGVSLMSGCGAVTTRPDAGSSPFGGGLSGAGGGLSGAGGGVSGAGGGSSSTGGGSAGGGAGGGMSGQPVDGGLNCLQLQPINWTSGAGSASLEFIRDGGTAVLSTGVVSGPSAQGPFLTVDATLYNEAPATPLVLPLAGTFQTISADAIAYPVSLLGLNCAMDGSNCMQVFFGVQGNYSITAAGVGASGPFNGAFTNIRYRQIDPMTFRAVPDGGCVDLAAFNFMTSWP